MEKELLAEPTRKRKKLLKTYFSEYGLGCTGFYGLKIQFRELV
jgi:hypothetical protein